MQRPTSPTQQPNSFSPYRSQTGGGGGKRPFLSYVFIIVIVLVVVFTLFNFHSHSSSFLQEQRVGEEDSAVSIATRPPKKKTATTTTPSTTTTTPTTSSTTSSTTTTTTTTTPTTTPTTTTAPTTTIPTKPPTTIATTLSPDDAEIKFRADSPPSVLTDHLPRNHFMSFASKEFECSLPRINNEASQTTIFQTIRLYKEDSLGKDFLNIVDTKKHKRGPGYYSWKPYLMLKRLDEGDIRRNEILVLADSGCTVSPYPNSFLADVRHLIDTDGDLVVRHLGTKHTLERWIKGDAFAAFNVTPNTLGEGQASEHLGHDKEGARLRFVPKGARLGVMPMFQGGILVARHTPRLRKLLVSWLRNMLKDNLRAVSDAKSTLQLDSPRFQDHRHDQAVLSLMIYTRVNFTEGIRPREDDSWTPGGTQQWRYLARSGVFILSTRWKECQFGSMFGPKEYQFVRFKRWMRWFN